MPIKPYAGFMDDELGLTSSVILTMIADTILKGKGGPLTLSKFAEETLSQPSDVRKELEHLLSEKKIRLESGELASAGSFHVVDFCFVLRADQKTLPLDAPEPPVTSSPDKPREETGFDDLIIGPDVYLGHVAYDGEQGEPTWILEIKVKPLDSSQEPEPILMEKSKVSMEEGWRYFENYSYWHSRIGTGEQLHKDEHGTAWQVLIAKQPPIEDVYSEKVDLKINRRSQEDATSTLTVEETFDTPNEAWSYVDEYLGFDPAATTVASELEAAFGPEDEPTAILSPWESDKAANAEFKVGKINVRYWPNWPDGYDWFEFTAEGQTKTFGILTSEFDGNKALGDVAEDVLLSIEWDPALKAGKKG